MKILVTGGSGFIGSNLARHLLAQTWVEAVGVIDDLSTGDEGNLKGLAVDLTQASILDFPVLATLARGYDAIVHLAALGSVPRSVAQPFTSHQANSTGTLHVLEAARSAGISQVIVASSSSVYGANPKLPKDEHDWTRPMSPYAVTKIATEGYALAYGYAYEMKTLAFRFFNVYGPGQTAGHPYAAVIPQFLEAALSGHPAVIHGDGLQSRDFTYVGTVCEVIGEALHQGLHSSGPINLAYGTNTSLLELLGVIEGQLGVKVARNHVGPRTGDVRASQADNTLLKRLVPNIEPLSLEEGINRTIEWFRTQGKNA